MATTDRDNKQSADTSDDEMIGKHTSPTIGAVGIGLFLLVALLIGWLANGLASGQLWPF